MRIWWIAMAITIGLSYYGASNLLPFK